MRRLRENVIVTTDFARSLCEVSNQLGRQIGALIDRQGRIRTLIVGDAHRIEIPDLERIGTARLRGLRLIHTHLYREPLTEEDLYDLTLLRLDFITAITMNNDGIPDLYYSAHVLPGEKPGYKLINPTRPGQLTEDFKETIDELEFKFRTTDAKLKDAKSLPKAFLVGVYTPEMRMQRTPDDSMLELRELCRTAGVEVVGEFIQKRPKIDPTTLIGSGKAKEISVQAVQEGVEMLIFDHQLTVSQATRAAKICDLKIVDRTQLILDIFARNAKSKDGKLQVELAQLRYMKGRLMETDDNLSRLTGGIDARGPGETKMEIGRRRISEKIDRLQRDLKQIQKRRELSRRNRKRNGIPVVSIVGYTNAGKSTLLNALTNSEVIVEDKLFATLDPTTRRIRFPKEREIIISDTVGFIHDLPPDLERAFEATLEELRDSDLLLHVVDASDPRREQKIAAVEKILGHIDCLELPTLRVYNKIDLVAEENQSRFNSQSVPVSAVGRYNLENLLNVIEETLFNERLTESVG